MAIAVAALIFFLRPAPICTDGKLNQHEEQIDCGGECEACIGNPSELVTNWVRFFEVAPGRYEAGAYVENPNLVLGLPSLKYQIDLYSLQNNIIASAQGITFANPREKFLIYEPNLVTLKKIPARAIVRFLDLKWKKLDSKKPELFVSRNEFTDDLDGGKLRSIIENQSLFPIQNISLSAILYDNNGNAVGVSISNLVEINGEEKANAYFTWRQKFNPTPQTYEVIARVNLFQK